MPQPSLAPGPARRLGTGALLLLLLAALGSAPVHADFPYPTCADAGCADPAAYDAYLFLPDGVLPDDLDPAARSSWKYLPGSGVDVTGAWRVTTGRPDVVIAVLDSGIRWDEASVARAVALNLGEIPVPAGCATHDCSGDGVVTVDDFDVPDANGNGIRDGQDVLRAFQDGVDDDANGFVDDIAGWDFADDDNDPSDDVDYGHGTGEAGDMVAEANDGAGAPGFAPSARHLPIRVADSFVAIGTDFAQGVVYAVDLDVDVISEALGAISSSRASQGAIDYAYRADIPVIASAADEESRHHNFPAVLDHTIWVNSIVHEDGTIVEDEAFDYLNGCTNYGGRAWVAISSNSCSSEATGRAAGLTALLVAHGRNEVARGNLTPRASGKPFGAEEIRQLFRRAAEDVDHAGALELTMDPLLRGLLSNPGLGVQFHSERFATTPGWDPYTGYGRPSAVDLLDLSAGLPPEADLGVEGGIAWFDLVDPMAVPSLEIRGRVEAARAPGLVAIDLEVGCGLAPAAFVPVASTTVADPAGARTLGALDTAATAAACGFDPAEVADEPEAHTITLRLRATDVGGRVGEDRRVLALHHDPTLRLAPASAGRGSLESSPALADVDGDGVLDLVSGEGSGHVRVLGFSADAAPHPIWDARTDPIPVHPSPAWDEALAGAPHEAVVGAVAADDLDGDGRVEVVAASAEGRLYVWSSDGARRPGFPVSTNPAFSRGENRDELNDTDPGIFAAPTLADLDDDGDLEILVAALDGHLYAWNADATPHTGFPVRIADPARVSIDAATGRATPLPGVDAKERAAKLISSPAVGDLDGDGSPEIVLASNEEYGDEPDGFAAESSLTALLLSAGDLGFDLGDLGSDVQGRVYAVRAEGSAHAGGAFVPGWPVRVPLVAAGVLPTVGTGTPGAPALADIDGDGTLEAAVFGIVGPVALLAGDGAPFLGKTDDLPRVLATDFPDGFPNVPAEAGSLDGPFFGALGSGAFGDLDGDGLPEFVAPTAGIRRLLDVFSPARQEPGDHQITAWNPRSGEVLAAFPRPIEDMQFLTTPSLADVSGDGSPEIVQGSGAYLLHAYDAGGREPAGWPKFTHGWLLAAPVAGDVDGDGRIEVVAGTREGRLFVWDTEAPDRAGSIPWQGFAGDRRNAGNATAAPSPRIGPAAGLARAVGTLGAGLDPTHAAGDLLARGSAALAAERFGKARRLLRRAERKLRGSPQEPSLAEALARFARSAVFLVDCGGEKRCERRLRRAEKRLARADAALAAGKERAARRGWLQVLARALALLPAPPTPSA